MSTEEGTRVEDGVLNDDTPTNDPPTDGVESTEETVAADAAAPPIDEAAPAAEEAPESIAIPESAWQKKADEYLAALQRSRAEFANYKKRTEREKADGRKIGAVDALTRLLPIIDDFERAVDNVPENLAEEPWIKGTELMLPKFHKLLAEFDVEVMDPTGEPFDPNRHEAIGMDDTDSVPSGHVTITLQKGYVSGERVLRPALVRVAN